MKNEELNDMERKIKYNKWNKVWNVTKMSKTLEKSKNKNIIQEKDKWENRRCEKISKVFINKKFKNSVSDVKNMKVENRKNMKRMYYLNKKIKTKNEIKVIW